ncbi:Hypothetical protein PBC10988_33710 [Planctomycetales bacterium 10988]|nr:Hypothetical protein PBC10988_33710 [Planctomycetales bacterium 10988]
MAHSFMHISDLPKEAVDPEFKNWIDIKGASSGMDVEFEDFTATRNRLRTLNKLNMEAIEVTRSVDRASLYLRLWCAMRKNIPSITLAFRRESDKELYLKYELQDVAFVGYSYSVDDGESPEETIRLNFRTIVWKFREKKDDKWGSWMKVGFDCQHQQEMQVK